MCLCVCGVFIPIVEKKQKLTGNVVSSSTSCTPPCEICSSQETSCTTNYSRIMKDISLIGSYNITVRATSNHGNVISNQYEFQSMKICEYHKVTDIQVMCLSFTSMHSICDFSLRLCLLSENPSTQALQFDGPLWSRACQVEQPISRIVVSL